MAENRSLSPGDWPPSDFEIHPVTQWLQKEAAVFGRWVSGRFGLDAHQFYIVVDQKVGDRSFEKGTVSYYIWWRGEMVTGVSCKITDFQKRLADGYEAEERDAFHEHGRGALSMFFYQKIERYRILKEDCDREP